MYSLQAFLSFAFLQKELRLSASLRTFCPGLLKNMGWKFAKHCGMTTQISWPKSDCLLRSVPIITYTEDTNGRVSLDKDCGASYNEMKGMIY